ncbi:MAG: hypothetical protein M1816_006173 [Peltula sp. TS41687]|nr:MAG: hypothetical protein M1816_006173 [Peltula sp. TS41687]
MALFAALREQPPTPPLERTALPRGHFERATNAAFSFTTSIAGPIVATPPSSSPPHPTGFSPRTDKKRKRVEWSAWTEYLKAPTFTGIGLGCNETRLRPIAPSKERKSSKSILKPYDRSLSGLATALSPTAQQPPLRKFKTMKEMLESVVQQLAGEARSPRLDAYLIMNQALKHYTEFPDSSAIGEKMGLLMQFIQRDISAKISASGGLDSVLITQAIKLLVILLWRPQLSCHLTDDFCRTILDHTITVLSSPPKPKIVMIHHLHLLSVQKFPSAILSADRANQIVSLLNVIEQSSKGKSVLCERLGVYQKLVTQAREVMISRAKDWVDHLFSGMLSGDKELRVRAITFGMAAALALGISGQVSREVKGIFDRPLNGDVFAKRIEQLLTKAIVAKDIGPDVPKVWGVVVLFLRSRPRQLEHWNHLKPWLLIIQKCFNSADLAVKMQANMAWNHMIFATYPRDWTSSSMINILRRPIVGQLEKSSSDRVSTSQCHNLALASLCCLLYYSLRPSAGPSQLDTYWEEYVVQIVVKCVVPNTNEAEYGLRILAALFDGTEQRAWKEHRAIDNQPISTEELPRIDPKWVRSRIHTVLKVCDVVFAKATWTDEPTQEAPVKHFWRNLTGSIADAGTMEVKLSTELMEAVAHIFNLLQHIWNRGPVALGVYGDDATDIFINRFGFLVTTTLNSLGPLAFTERLLTQKSKNELEAVGTPSSRSSKHHNVAGESLLTNVFQLLARPNLGYSLTPAYYDLARTVAETCCRSRHSFDSQLAVLNDCMHFLTALISQEESKPAWRHLWHVVVELATPIIHTSTKEAISSSEPLTSEYQEMIKFLVKLLQHGCSFDDAKSLSVWQGLIDRSVAAILTLTGQAGVIQDILEPIASGLRPNTDQAVPPDLLSRATYIIDNLYPPKEKDGKDQIKSMDNLYYMMNAVLTASYKHLSESNDAQTALFLLSVKNSIIRCPLPILITFLNRIQDSLGLWIADGEQKLGEEEQSIRETYLTLLDLGSEISHAIELLPQKDSLLLRNLEVLVCSGLQSRSEEISKEARILWNSTFGTQDTLEYPEKIKDALSKLRAVTDLRLPSFPITSQHEDVVTDSWPRQTEDGLVESSSHLERPTRGGSQAMQMLERSHQSQPVSNFSSPSGGLKTYQRTPSLNRHASDPTANKWSPSQVAMRNKKALSKNTAQVAVVIESTRPSPAQQTTAVDLCIDTDSSDLASALQLSNEAARAAISEDDMDAVEESSDRSGVRSVSPSERRAAMQSPSTERMPYKGSRGVGKHNHSSTASASIQYDAHSRKRRFIPTDAEGPTKRIRGVSSQQDAGTEIFDCITVQHSPTSNDSGSQQSRHIRPSDGELGHDPNMKGPNNTRRKRRMSHQSDVEVTNHSSLQVVGLTQVESTGDIEGSTKSCKVALDLAIAETPSRSIASRVKRRRLASKRGRGLSSEEQGFQKARTALEGGSDEYPLVEETHISIAPEAEAPSDAVELISSGVRRKTSSVDAVESSSPRGHHAIEGPTGVEQRTDQNDKKSREGVQTISYNIQSIAQSPGQDCQIRVTRTPGPPSDETRAEGAETDMSGRGEDQTSAVMISSQPAATSSNPVETTGVMMSTMSTSESQPSQSQSRPPAVSGIIGGLKRILSDLRRAVLGPQEVRQIDDLLFDAKRETFAAERRHEGGGEL